MIVTALVVAYMALGSRRGLSAAEGTELRRDLASCLAVAVLLRLTVKSTCRVRP